MLTKAKEIAYISCILGYKEVRQQARGEKMERMDEEVKGNGCKRQRDRQVGWR